MAASPRKRREPTVAPWTPDLPEQRPPQKPPHTPRTAVPIGPFTKKAAEAVLGWKRKDGHRDPV